MQLPTDPEYWLRLAKSEGNSIITAGVPDERDALWQCQLLAAIGIEETGDTGPLADLFAKIHSTAAGALMAKGPVCNEEGKHHG
jgi:hypothetical protein